MKINKIQTYRPVIQAHNKSQSFQPSFIAHKNEDIHSITWHREIVGQTMDNAYKSDLLKFANLPEYSINRISAIMGPYETQKVLQELDKSEQNFIASSTNIQNGKFRANLHIHTQASDGYYTPEELLSDSAEYADKVWEKTGENFTIAITDHDTIGSYNAIIKEIYSNPDKYKHLKVILGMESTTFDNVEKYPIQFHMLVYNINPIDKKFTDFLNNQQIKKKELIQTGINKINGNYCSQFNQKTPLFTYEELQREYPPIRKNIMSSHNYLRNYCFTKFLVKEVLTKSEFFDEYFKKENSKKNVDLEMQKLHNYQYDLCHNNKSIAPIILLKKFYSKTMNTTPEAVETAIYDCAKQSDKIMQFIATMNNQLLNHKNIDGRNFYVNINEVYEALSNQPNAILGIAHPLNIVLDKIPDNKNFDLYNKILYEKKVQKTKSNLSPEFLEQFYKRFKETGKEKTKFSEKYYQSYPLNSLSENMLTTINECLEQYSKQNNLLRTGGYDCHRKTIFSRY